VLVWWNDATKGSATATYMIFIVGLIVDSFLPNSLETLPGRLFGSNKSIAAYFYNDSRRMVSVSLVE
jgi:hypothetical protein